MSDLIKKAEEYAEATEISVEDKIISQIAYLAGARQALTMVGQLPGVSDHDRERIDSLLPPGEGK